MVDVTSIIDIGLKILVAVLSIVVIPMIKANFDNAKLDKVEYWLEKCVNAAEEAARIGLIDKTAKYDYAKTMLAKKGITFDADVVEALINSTCWQLFNQFKDDSAGT